ncbi:MAG: hypothetical protein K6G52_02660 [Treponemataceae bacterium]|nr:hypothetical protein [Treponemataceae bacterium]
MIEDIAGLIKDDSTGSQAANGFLVEYYADGLNSSATDYSNPIKTAVRVQNSTPQDYTAETLPGFTYSSREVGQNTSGTTVLKLIYTRNLITLTFDISESPNNALWNIEGADHSVYTVTKKFGTPTSNVTPDDSNMTFSNSYFFYGWGLSRTGELAASQLPASFPESNVTFYARWVTSSANYTVKYFYEDVSTSPSTYIENTTQSYTDSGRPGTQITYEANAVALYNEPVVSGDTVIKADGSSVLEIRYEKASVTLSFASNGGTWTDDSSTESRQLTGKIGASLSAADTAKLAISKDEYTFVGWNNGTSTGSNPRQYPESNVSYTAQWSQNAALYTVQFWYENANLGSGNHYLETHSVTPGNFTLTDHYDDTAEIGQSISIDEPSVTGFTAIDREPLLITTNPESNIINVYYHRNAITLTYKSDSDSAVNGGTEYGKFSDESTSKLVSGYFGDTVATSYSGSDVSKLTASKTWVFASWSSTPATTFPSANENYIAQWTQTEALYTVRYYFENIVSGVSNWVEDQDRRTSTKAAVGSTTAIAVADQEEVEGYCTPEVTNVIVVPEATSVVNVRYPQMASPTPSVVNPGVNDIVLTVTVNGNNVTAVCTHPNATLTTYKWYVNGNRSNVTASTLNLTNLSAGTYSIYVVASNQFATYTQRRAVTVE